MQSKKRIEKVMDLEIPDRIPFDGIFPFRSDIYYMLLSPSKSWQPEDKPEVFPNVNSLVLKYKGWKWTPKNWTPPETWRFQARTGIDEFGCLWEFKEADNFKGYPIGSHLTNWDLLADWKFPDPYDSSRYRPFARLRHIFPRKYKIGILDSFLFARHQYLRGFSTSLSDYLKHGSNVKELMEKLQTYFIGTVEMWHKFGAQAVYTMDDMGTQNSLFMSPRLYKKFIAPIFQSIVQRAHDLDMKFILHSCGHVNDLIPIWIDIGVDALQFDSPHMTGIDFLKNFVGKIAFHLVPDIQKVYPVVSPEQLEQEVKMMMEVLGHSGGLIIRDYEEAESVLHVAKANVKKLPKIVKKWGQYPLTWT